MKIKYFNEDYPRLKQTEIGNWIDLRVDRVDKTSGSQFMIGDELFYSKGDIITFGLGVAMELPEGYEALVAPRSSTYNNYGLIQTNSIGVIDTVYSGDNDEWLIQFYATRDGIIERHDRVCQFRIIESQPTIEFEEVKYLGNEDRGGYGSTGRR